jgi:hypothetical protein
MPPLPNLSGGGQAPGPQQSQLAQVMSGVAPVKMAVDGIVKACQAIVKSGAVPGAEQVCGQIVALATSLLPMAIQSAMQPGQGGGQGGPGGGGAPPPGPVAPPGV